MMAVSEVMSPREIDRTRIVRIEDVCHEDQPLDCQVRAHGDRDDPICSVTIEAPWLSFYVAMTAAEMGELYDAIGAVLGRGPGVEGAENERLRDVLAFYADGFSYLGPGSVVFRDRGARARAALDEGRAPAGVEGSE